MNNLEIITNELRNRGFGVYQGVDYVKVYLKSRKVSVMEIEIALNDAFEDIYFDVTSNGNSVIVKEW